MKLLNKRLDTQQKDLEVKNKFNKMKIVTNRESPQKVGYQCLRTRKRKWNVQSKKMIILQIHKWDMQKSWHIVKRHSI